MLSTAVELVPRSKRPRGAQGWCAGPGAETEINAEWQQREEATRHLGANLHSINLQKAVKMAGNMPSSWYSVKRRIRQSAAATGVSRWLRTPARYC